MSTITELSAEERMIEALKNSHYFKGNKLEILVQLHSTFNAICEKNVGFHYEDNIDLYNETGGGRYFPHANIIHLYKLSMMTFLHEWYHALHGENEVEARRWSHNMFKTAWPKTYAKSAEKGLFFHSENGEDLNRPRPRPEV